MHEIKEKVDNICELKDKLVLLTKEEMAKGAERIDTKELGEVIDMIKDLAEAEEKIWKGCYYKSIVEAMEEYDDEEEERYGYNNRRYASGRYAPKGRGRRMGYIPPIDYDDYGHPHPMLDGDYMTTMMNPRMGYPDSGMMRSQTGRDINYTSTGGNSYGRKYDRYQDAKRHYTESRSKKDKDEMDASAIEHVTETAETIREIWRNADPDLRKRMKADLSGLMSEMNI